MGCLRTSWIPVIGFNYPNSELSYSCGRLALTREIAKKDLDERTRLLSKST